MDYVSTSQETTKLASREASMPARFSALRFQVTEVCCWLLYASIVFATVSHHEPWADEAQAWLLARDAGLFDLWTHLLRLEGSPGLWHTLLHVLTRLQIPYSGMNVFSASLGCLAALLLLRSSPFPLVIRALFPFTYFLCYQYAVVARSYSLMPALLFAIAMVYRVSNQRALLLSVLLSLLAMVSVQGFLLSVAIAFTVAARTQWRWKAENQPRTRRLLGAASFYVVTLFVIASLVWPSKDASFAGTPNWTLSNAVGISRYAFQQAFGAGYWPAAVVGLSLPLLWRGRGLLFFALASLFLCGFGALIYSNVWHHGLLLLAWLFAIWISAKEVRIGWPALLAMSIVIVMQCSWTWKAVAYDWRQPYSGSRAMARYLKDKHIDLTNSIGVGFSTVAVKAYFPPTLFRNERGTAFWRWAKSNGTNDALETLGSAKPACVLLGYGNEADRKLWTHLITSSGYRQEAKFEGHLFWRDGLFEPETFELYQLSGPARNSLPASVIRPNDVDTADQMLWGFADLAEGNGRGTGAGFSVALQRPVMQAGQQSRQNSGRAGVQLQVDLTIAAEDFKRIGPLTLTAYVGGGRIAPMTFRAPGHHQYRREVPADNLYWAIVPVAFHFASVRPSWNDLPGKVAVVSSIGLVAE